MVPGVAAAVQVGLHHRARPPVWQGHGPVTDRLPGPASTPVPLTPRQHLLRIERLQSPGAGCLQALVFDPWEASRLLLAVARGKGAPTPQLCPVPLLLLPLDHGLAIRRQVLCLLRPAMACGLRRTCSASPQRRRWCGLRCAFTPAASATSCSRSGPSAAGGAVTPLACRMRCRRVAPRGRRVPPPRRQGRQTRDGWVARPDPPGTFTREDTPSVSWRENAPRSAAGATPPPTSDLAAELQSAAFPPSAAAPGSARSLGEYLPSLRWGKIQPSCRAKGVQE
jgi:hypothetical protein